MDTQRLDEATPPEEPKPIEYGTAAWDAAFRAQMTPQTMQQVMNYAAALLRGLDGLICPSTAEDLVQDAILATHDGSATWLPDRVSLRARLASHVRAALERMRKRATRSESIEARLDTDPDLPDDSDRESSSFERAHLSVELDLAGQLELRTVAREAEAALWQRFANDQPAMAVLNAIAAGATDNPTIATVIGVPIGQVETIRQRIRRGLVDLPQSLRQRVKRVLS